FYDTECFYQPAGAKRELTSVNKLRHNCLREMTIGNRCNTFHVVSFFLEPKLLH
ncbi:unnamed protein product, partial [Brassica oleracea]